MPSDACKFIDKELEGALIANAILDLSNCCFNSDPPFTFAIDLEPKIFEQFLILAVKDRILKPDKRNSNPKMLFLSKDPRH